MASQEQIDELILAASVCASERCMSRRLVAAIVAVNPDLAHDAETARRADQLAQRIVVGGRPQPDPVTAADRVWLWLDTNYGHAITSALGI